MGNLNFEQEIFIYFAYGNNPSLPNSTQAIDVLGINKKNIHFSIKFTAILVVLENERAFEYFGIFRGVF